MKSSRILLLFSALLCLAHNATAQKLPLLIPFNKGGLWGYCDSTKKIIVPCIYSRAESIKQGLGIVKMNGAYGVVNANGKVIFQPQYQDAVILNCGLITLKKGGNYGVFSPSGGLLIDFNFSAVRDFTEKHFKASYTSGKWQIYDAQAKPINKSVYTYAPLGIVNNFNCKITSANSLYYILHLHNGSETLLTGYDEVYDFSGGFALARKGKRFCFIDSTGTESMVPECEKVFGESMGICCFKQNGKWGYFSATRGVIADAVYDLADGFYRDQARVQLSGKWGCLNPDGTMAIECNYDEIVHLARGYFGLKNDKKWALADSTGKLITAFDFEELRYGGVDLIAAKKNGAGMGYINKMGKAVTPFTFSETAIFWGAFASAKQNDKWGIIDKKGTFIVKPVYNYINHMPDNLYLAEKEAIQFYIDAKGTVYYEKSIKPASVLSSVQLNKEEKQKLLVSKWQPRSYTDEYTKTELDFPEMRSVVFFPDSYYIYESPVTTIKGKWQLDETGKKIHIYNAKKYSYSSSYGYSLSDEYMEIVSLNESEMVLKGRMDKKKQNIRFALPEALEAYDEKCKHGWYVSWYPGNKQKKEEGRYILGKKNGLWTSWYANGKLSSTGNYADDYKSYGWKYYDKNGLEVSEEQMKKNELTEGEGILFDPDKNGEYQENWSSGAIKKLGALRNGLEQGMWICWDSGGDKTSQGTYNNGKRTGNWIFWEKSGKQRTEIFYKDGKQTGMSVTRNEQDVIIEQGEYIDGVKQGKWSGSKSKYSSSYSSGTYEEYYIDGKLNGKRIERNSDGKKLKEENYWNDHLEGKSTNWYSNGTISKEVYYSDGKEEHGISFTYKGIKDYETFYTDGKETKNLYFNEDGTLWKEKIRLGNDTMRLIYFKEGKKSSEGLERRSKKEGTWKYYDSNGNVEGVEEYIYGKLEGECVYYYPDGKVKRRENYYNNKKHGTQKEYAPDGSLKKETEYKYGVQSY